MFHLEVNQLHKSYGDTPVFEGIEFGIRKGELVTLLGPSGCGKSTLLRALAGLTPVDGGQVRVAGEDITWQAPQKRGIGMVFQSYALFPNMTVWDNVAFGLKMKPQPGRELSASVKEALALVELTGFERRYPAELSGGQRQRVALARALVHDPQLLLLDEPLGALDALTRIEMHRLIEGLWRNHGFTALLVTHDVQEAVALADRVVLIEDGRIALDERIKLRRPRVHGDPGFAQLETRILDRVLQKPDAELAEQPRQDSWLGVPATGLRWAI